MKLLTFAVFFVLIHLILLITPVFANSTSIISDDFLIPDISASKNLPSQILPNILEKSPILSNTNIKKQSDIHANQKISHPGIVANPSHTLTNESSNDSVNVFHQYAYDPGLVYKTVLNGQLIDRHITGPGLPPKEWKENANRADLSSPSVNSISQQNVPIMRWSYGCSPTSATMLFGYYDRMGYSNIYIGPVNGGVFPLTNQVWGSSSDGQGQCPMSASQYGLDGRTVRGHKDDYYNGYNSAVDPYFSNSWTEHSPMDCIADYMGTSMYRKYSNLDGSTTFWYYTNGAPTHDFTASDLTSRDGMHGMKLFAESRGYTVLTNYNQYIDAKGLDYGFTYSQYKNEIDAGYPVLIQLEGHTVLGVGYSGDNQLIIHDTWSYLPQSMTWGGYYGSMKHYGVGVIHLQPVSEQLDAKFYGIPDPEVFPLTVHFFDATVGNPTSWIWSFGDGGVNSTQNPVYSYNTPGTFNVTLTVSNGLDVSQKSLSLSNYNFEI